MTTTIPTESPREIMSFREKSAWAALAVMLVVFIPYFVHIFQLFGQGKLNLGYVLGGFLGAVALQVALLIVVSIVLAIRSREEPKDERDLEIESKSFKIAYYILTLGCFGGIPTLILCVLPFAPEMGPQLVAPLFLSQLLLLCFVVAEAAKYITQVVCYRRGS